MTLPPSTSQSHGAVDEDESAVLLDDEQPTTSTGVRVTAEYSVVWSATYHVPMLWFRAWDESE